MVHTIHDEYMPALNTPRLKLRRLTMGDAADIFDYSSDPMVARHVLWDPMRSIADARTYIKFMIRKYRLERPASWGIVHGESGRVIGTIGYMWIRYEDSSAEVGYSLSRRYWNNGYMSEALSRVIDYSFQELLLNRIEAQCETDNPASGAVMRKCGMKHEGVLRERLFNKGRYVDMGIYSILRREWLNE